MKRPVQHEYRIGIQKSIEEEVKKAYNSLSQGRKLYE